LAPSFPAEFAETTSEQLVGMLRKLGFRSVHEVGFGADLVAREYQALLNSPDNSNWIATTCPAVTGYVERYHPSLVPWLAPIVSPMIAMARYLKRFYQGERKVVFIGPCIAKKREAQSKSVIGEVDAVLTFVELRKMLEQQRLTPSSVTASDFDPPRARNGALFPLSHGLLEVAQIDQGLSSLKAIASEGRIGGFEALDELGRGLLSFPLVEVLACKGCIMGPGMSCAHSRFSRHTSVVAYVRGRPALEIKPWRKQMDQFSDLDLRRSFSTYDQRLSEPSDEELAKILSRMGKATQQDELNCGACGYETCREHAKAVFSGLAELEMCLPYAIEHLRQTLQELAISHEKLASAQEALMHAERLASMGQLAAGIAHEVNNPLGVVLMYSHLLLEEISADHAMRDNLTMIAEQTNRCKRIVAGLLNFARQNTVVPQALDLRELINSSVGAIPIPSHLMVEVCHEGNPLAELDRDQIAQVIINLLSNAYDATPFPGKVFIQTSGNEKQVCIKICDQGTGISAQNLGRIFEPFFTTKPMGRGTGLGLPVSYGIIKMHHGDIQVESQADPSQGPTGTTFTIKLPRRPLNEDCK
jgi:signal transduction histidine kinase